LLSTRCPDLIDISTSLILLEPISIPVTTKDESFGCKKDLTKDVMELMKLVAIYRYSISYNT
jgi:hypothetical protein